MDFDSGPSVAEEPLGASVGNPTPGVEVAPAATTPIVLPYRRTVPLQIQSDAPQRNKHKLKPDQIVAIVLLGLLLGGIICMTLALCGVFNRTPPAISLTPTVVITSRVPSPLPTVVMVA